MARTRPRSTAAAAKVLREFDRLHRAYHAWGALRARRAQRRDPRAASTTVSDRLAAMLRTRRRSPPPATAVRPCARRPGRADTFPHRHLCVLPALTPTGCRPCSPRAPVDGRLVSRATGRESPARRWLDLRRLHAKGYALDRAAAILRGGTVNAHQTSAATSWRSAPGRPALADQFSTWPAPPLPRTSCLRRRGDRHLGRLPALLEARRAKRYCPPARPAHQPAHGGRSCAHRAFRSPRAPVPARLSDAPEPGFPRRGTTGANRSAASWHRICTAWLRTAPRRGRPRVALRAPAVPVAGGGDGRRLRSTKEGTTWTRPCKPPGCLAISAVVIVRRDRVLRPEVRAPGTAGHRRT